MNAGIKALEDALTIRALQRRELESEAWRNDPQRLVDLDRQIAELEAALETLRKETPTP